MKQPWGLACTKYCAFSMAVCKVKRSNALPSPSPIQTRTQVLRMNTLYKQKNVYKCKTKIKILLIKQLV